MDEAATDMTKHRSKVIVDALSMVHRFALTPEGDVNMNMHITMCLTTQTDRISKDTVREVKGACCPLLIHMEDKSKKNQKEKDECQRHCQGNTPATQQVNYQFQRGLEGCFVV
jgi:hypothetical protein